VGLFTLIHVGRAEGALPAALGAANEVYSMYMSERQQRDVGKAPRPEGLRLRGCHAAVRTLAVDDYGAAARALPDNRGSATRPARISVNRPYIIRR
jgi:hypothetical protein